MASDRVVKILQSGYRKIRDMLDTDRVYVALYDSRRGYLEFPLIEPPDERGGAEPARWNERLLHVPEQPTSNDAQVLSPDWVVAQKKPLLYDNVMPAEFEAGRLAYWPDEPLPCAWLGVPLVTEDQILGALVVENHRQTGVFGSKVGLLSMIAGSLTTAVANAQLREQMERQITRLKALHDMGQQLTASIQLSEQEIIELIYEQASRVMDAKNMYIALYDEATDTVSFALAYRDDRRVDVEREAGWQPRAGGQGRTEEIIRTREPLFTALRKESEAWYSEEGHRDYIEQPFASWVGVPMVAGQKVLGVIATYHAAREYAYDKDDVQTLTMFASQAAVAMENARLLASERDWARISDAVQRAGTDIVSKHDLREVLETIVQSANNAFSADFSSLFTYDAAQDKFETSVRDGQIATEPETPSSTGLAARIVKTKEPAFPTNEEEERVLGVKPAIIEEKSVKAFAGVPLVYREKSVGVLFVNFFRDHRFSDREKEIIGLLANQAAVAIENARQMQKTQEFARKEKWYKVGQLASMFAHQIGGDTGLIRAEANKLMAYIDKSQGEQDIQEHVRQSLDNIMRISSNMAEFSTLLSKPVRASAEALVPIAVNLLVEDALRKTILPAEIQVHTEFPKPSPKAKANRYVVDVLREVFSNAAEAMRNSSQQKLTVEVNSDQDWVRIAISDTGPGIPPEEQDRIFEQFTSKHAGEKDGHHFGFGLWWARTFLRDIKGDIEILSGKPGQGATFVIKLPCEDKL